MDIKKFEFANVVEIIPACYHDNRGHFRVTYNERAFSKVGLPTNFLQDNESFSIKGTLRGLHFQIPPYAQGKLVRVIDGLVQDVIVDLRNNSPTFGKWKSFYLSSELGNILYVPEGFAHGFLALTDCIFSYKCTKLYEKSAESGIIWNDPTLNIQWDIKESLIISDKDLMLQNFNEALNENYK